MKHISKFVSLYSLVIIAIFIAFYLICNQTYRTIGDHISNAFDAAIISDLNLRAKEANLLLSQGYSRRSATASHYFSEERQNGQTVHEKNETLQTLPNQEKLNLAKQTYLSSKNPVNTAVLDSFFRTELEKQNIDIPVTVSFSNNRTKEISHYPAVPDAFRNRPGISRRLSIRRTTGLHDEITLQGFAEISPATVFRYAPRSFIICSFVGVCAVAGLPVSTIIRRRRKRAVSLSAPETPESLPKTGADLPEPSFSLDPIEQTLIYPGGKIRLTKDMFRLFETVWNSEHHFASYEDISGILYPKVDIHTGKHRLSQAVCGLQKKLGRQELVRIENVSGKGYRILSK